MKLPNYLGCLHISLQPSFSGLATWHDILIILRNAVEHLLFFSQARSLSGQAEHGEDGIIGRILEELRVECRFCVEFGAGDGVKNSVTYPFRLAGARSLLMDGMVEMDRNSHGQYLGPNCETSAGSSVQSIRDNNQNVKLEFINAENINSLFVKYRVPYDFQLLVIDIDGNEYHIWKALEFAPDVVMIEYNQHIRPDLKCTIPYDPNFRTSVKSRFVSASCSALASLGKQKGYTLVEVDKINMIFVKNDLVECLETGVAFQDDFLFLFLKNIIKHERLYEISRLGKNEQFLAIDELRSVLVNGYLSGEKSVWNCLNVDPYGHKYGPWEFVV